MFVVIDAGANGRVLQFYIDFFYCAIFVMPVV